MGKSVCRSGSRVPFFGRTGWGDCAETSAGFAGEDYFLKTKGLLVFYVPPAKRKCGVNRPVRSFVGPDLGLAVPNKQALPRDGRKRRLAAPLLTVRADRKIGCPKSFNFNVFNLREQSAGCFGETKKDLRKTIRHLEKTTKHLEKIIRQVVAPSPGLFFCKSGQKETEEALYLREVLGIAMQIYNIFQRKANRQNCILTFREQCRPCWISGRRADDPCRAGITL